MDIVDTLLEKASEYMDEGGVRMLREALEIAERKHHGVQRRDGTEYFLHTVNVGLILVGWKAPAEVVSAGLLHDVLKNNYSRQPSLEGIEGVFPPQVVDMIREVNSIDVPEIKLSETRKVTVNKATAKSLWATAMLRKNPEAVIIKIADRLHNLETSAYIEHEVDFAQNILHIFASVAYRLGMGEAMRQLQDYSFRVVDPEAYDNADKIYLEALADPELERLIAEIRERAGDYNLDAEVSHFFTHRYGIHRKTLERKGIPPSAVDILSVNVLTHSAENCYRALQIMHDIFEPLDDVRDFIARPKRNGYRALHTRVLKASFGAFQIAIMTWDMYKVAERGVTAGWLGVSPLMLPSIERIEQDPEEILILTPQGEVKNLPPNSTPVDFAYSLHPQIGHRCLNALVNGVWTPLSAQLQSGDVVDIIVGRGTSGPDANWLNFVVTDKAKKEIRSWTRRKSKVEFHIDAYDRSGLVREITSILTNRGFNIKYFNAASSDDGSAKITFRLTGVETSDLGEMVKQLEAIPYVFGVVYHEGSTAEWDDLAVKSAAEKPPVEAQTGFVENPWSTGRPAVKHFKGRQVEINKISSKLRGAENINTMLIWGQRRIGKTSLLVHLRDQVFPALRCIPIYIDLQRMQSATVGQLLQKIASLIADKLRHESINAPSGNKMKREPIPYFQTFIEQVGKFAGPQNLVIMLDEFEGIDDLREEGATREDVFYSFRYLIQHNIRVSFLFCAGGVLRYLMQRPALSSLFSVSDHVRVECMEKEDARALITEPASFIEFSDAAIERLLEVTGCHPCYIQYLCRVIYEKASTQRMTVGVEDVATVVGQSLQSRSISTLEGMVAHFWVIDVGNDPGANLKNRAVLSAIASRGSMTFDLLAGKLSPSIREAEIAESLSGLLEYGSIVKDGADYRVAIPIFEMFLREKYPLDQVLYTLK